MIQLPLPPPSADDITSIQPSVSTRVIIAFDQLTSAERQAVISALQRLAHEGLQSASSLKIKRLNTPDPFFSLSPAPDLQVIIRVTPGAPIEIEDILRPAAFANFIHAT